MINRRSLIKSILAGCCFEGVCYGATRPFICSVPDQPVELSEGGINFGSDLNPSINYMSSNGPVTFTPYGTAFKKDIWLLSDSLRKNAEGKIYLGIHFLDGRPSQKEAVKVAVNTWQKTMVGDLIDFVLDVSYGDAHARITFNTNMNWSCIGRTGRDWGSAATMQLSDLEPGPVLHEIGHFLGLQHEHQFPKSGIRWNEDFVIKEMSERGWDVVVTREQIFQRLSEQATCIGDPKFNSDSIMMYPIPPGWATMKDAYGSARPFVVSQAHAISPRDVACVVGLYKSQ